MHCLVFFMRKMHVFQANVANYFQVSYGHSDRIIALASVVLFWAGTRQDKILCIALLAFLIDLPFPGRPVARNNLISTDRGRNLTLSG